MFAAFGQEGYCDPMHGAVLADFSRCLHVRKRKYPSPSDLGNGSNAWVNNWYGERRAANRNQNEPDDWCTAESTPQPNPHSGKYSKPRRRDWKGLRREQAERVRGLGAWERTLILVCHPG